LTLALDEMFEKRLRQAETDVVREFNAVDRELVHREFERVTQDLLRNATVTDFVPVLARRHVRDHLMSMPAAAPAGT
jgi:Protein of unknown function (DUF3562)